MRCAKCNNSIPESSRFCQYCGEEQNGAIYRAAAMEQAGSYEIRAERSLAMLKRLAVIEKTRHRKRIVTIAAIVVAVILVVILGISAAQKAAHNGELRNFATDEMRDIYTNVYADVVSMEPEYFVYSKYGATPYQISEVICKCQTVEGKTIWAAFFAWEYPGGSTYREESFLSYRYSKADPLRLIGSVETAEDVIEELESAIGDIFVLNVDELEEK